MEGIIRPFQNIDRTPKPVVGGIVQQVSPNVILTFGKNGGGKTGNISISASTTSYITKKQKEVTQG
jgi:signal recognition particle GTPase